jgi:hypothetical protein
MLKEIIYFNKANDVRDLSCITLGKLIFYTAAS